MNNSQSRLIIVVHKNFILGAIPIRDKSVSKNTFASIPIPNLRIRLRDAVSLRKDPNSQFPNIQHLVASLSFFHF
jgi:hypothetical protein